MIRRGNSWWAFVSVAVAAVLLAAVWGGAHFDGSSSPTQRPAQLTLATPLKATCSVGVDPGVSAYDPVTHEVYVPNERSGTVTVLEGACTLVGTITFANGSIPWQAAFDPANNYMYVTDLGLNQVYLISGLTVSFTLGGFFHPEGVAYDPGDQAVVVTNEAANNVTIVQNINPIASLPVGCGPEDVAYDPYFGTLLVTNPCSYNVTVLNAIFLSHVADVTVGAGIGPGQIVFDPADSLDYVTFIDAAVVTVLSGSGGIVANFTLGTHVPTSIGWSQKDLAVFVDSGYGKVYELSGTSILKSFTPAVGTFDSYGMTYDEQDDEMYVSVEGNGAGYVQVLS